MHVLFKCISPYSSSHLRKMGDTSSYSDCINYVMASASVVDNHDSHRHYLRLETLPLIDLMGDLLRPFRWLLLSMVVA